MFALASDRLQLRARRTSAAVGLGCLLCLAACPSEQMRPVSFTTTLGTDTAGDGDGDGDPGDGDGDGDGDSGDGDGEPGPPPTVVATSPAPGTLAVPADASISVTFSEAMDPASVTTNGGSDVCSGALQVSDDGFATCLALDSVLMVSSDAAIFTAKPTVGLDSRRDYTVRVASFATSLAGVELGEVYTAEGSFQTAYFHTIEIDGDNDFDVGDESFATTSPGFTGYVAWDLDNVYLGLEGVDVASGSPNLFWFVYIGGNGGSTSGVDYMGQAPALPFPARWHLRWKADGTYTNMQQYDGGWIDTDGSWPQVSDWANLGELVELRIPRTQLANPASLRVVMGLLREASNDATFAGVPDTAFADGFDPDIANYFEFELDGSVLPTEHTAQ